MQVHLETIRSIKVIKNLANRCVEEPDFLDEMMLALSNGTRREKYTVSWIISHAIDIKHSILNDAQHKFFLNIINEHNDGGIRRNLIRVWQFTVPESEDLRFLIIECALNLLSDIHQDLAVRVFSITVLENMLQFMPEIKEEVLFLIDKEYFQASPSFKVRADRFRKKATKIH